VARRPGRIAAFPRRGDGARRPQPEQGGRVRGRHEEAASDPAASDPSSGRTTTRGTTALHPPRLLRRQRRWPGPILCMVSTCHISHSLSLSLSRTLLYREGGQEVAARAVEVEDSYLFDLIPKRLHLRLCKIHFYLCLQGVR
jgi:hypothetical protein